MTNNEQDQLIEELFVLETIVRDNPCGMSHSIMKSIGLGIKAILHAVDTDLNLEQVSRYFGVDARTIRNWRKEYPDFPRGKEAGNKSLSFTAEEIVLWEHKHHKRKVS